MIFYLVAGLFLSGLGLLLVQALAAPEGYQDAAGFHYCRPLESKGDTGDDAGWVNDQAPSDLRGSGQPKILI